MKKIVPPLLGYFTVTSSQVLLTSLGASTLIPGISGRAQNSWNGKSLKKGTPLYKELTAEINSLQQKINIAPTVAVSDHHIFPGNLINTVLKGALPTKDGLKRVNDYINSRAGIRAKLRYQIDE
jgi:hypothetical protein